jgi:hypothetical protein
MEPQFSSQRNHRREAAALPDGDSHLQVTRARDERHMIRLIAAVLLSVLAPAAAFANQQAVIAINKWKAMDTCAVQAQAAYPDFTAEANAKRDAKLKECLAQQNLPPRQPFAAPR